MPLTVPDESYVSVADADTYWSNRNNLDWQTADPANKEKALREATEYIDNTYDGQWIGTHPGSTSQVRSWPRNNAVDTQGRDVTGIPQRIKDATSRLALDNLEKFLVKAESRGGQVERAKLGSMDVTFARNAPAGRTYAYLDLLLVGLLTGRGNRLSRV